MSRRETSWWFSHFIFADGRVRVPASGGDIKLDRQLIADALRWMTYYLLVRAKSALNALTRRPGARIWFAPVAPRPWYIIWAARTWAGLRVARTEEEADAAFYFEDRTWGSAPQTTRRKKINFQCTDVSKSHVGAVFEAVFGYPLAVDPATFTGRAVEKSEENGRHDGRLIICPAPWREGMCYQRFIDTMLDGAARDLRTPCVGGRPVIVMVKLKPPQESFSIQNASVKACSVESVFSPAEIALIERFTAKLGMDWGSLDILRETATGRIYIVDANKTDTGPPVVLSWADRVTVTEALANALRALVERVSA